MSHHDEHGHHDCGCGCGGHVPAAPASLDWAQAPADQLICPCLGLTKGDILAAIQAGAFTLPLLKTMTGAGRGRDCKKLHPQGHSCEGDLMDMLALYAQRPGSWPAGGCGH